MTPDLKRITEKLEKLEDDVQNLRFTHAKYDTLFEQQDKTNNNQRELNGRIFSKLDHIEQTTSATNVSIANMKGRGAIIFAGAMVVMGILATVISTFLIRGLGG